MLPHRGHGHLSTSCTPHCGDKGCLLGSRREGLQQRAVRSRAVSVQIGHADDFGDFGDWGALFCSAPACNKACDSIPSSQTDGGFKPSRPRPNTSASACQRINALKACLVPLSLRACSSLSASMSSRRWWISSRSARISSAFVTSGVAFLFSRATCAAPPNTSSNKRCNKTARHQDDNDCADNRHSATPR